MMRCKICGGELKSANTFSNKEEIEKRLNLVENIDISKVDPDHMIIRSRRCDNCNKYFVTVELIDHMHTIDKRRKQLNDE